MSWSHFMSSPELLIPALALCIPIVAIIVGGIVAIVKSLIAHRERMGMIEQGLHPDHPPEDEDS